MLPFAILAVQTIVVGRRGRVRGQPKVAAEFALRAAAVNLARLAVRGVFAVGSRIVTTNSPRDMTHLCTWLMLKTTRRFARHNSVMLAHSTSWLTDVCIVLEPRLVLPHDVA